MTWVNTTPEGNGLAGCLLIGIIGGGLLVGSIGLMLDPYVHEQFRPLFSWMMILFWIGIPISLMVSWHYLYQKQMNIFSPTSPKPKILKFFVVYFCVIFGITLLIVMASGGKFESENPPTPPNFQVSNLSSHAICPSNYCYDGQITAIIKNNDNFRYENIPVKISLYTDNDVRFFYTFYSIKDINPYESVKIEIPVKLNNYDILKRFVWDNTSIKLNVFPLNYDYKQIDANRYQYERQLEPDTDNMLKPGHFGCGYFISEGSGKTPSTIGYLKNFNTVPYEIVKINFLIYDKNKVRIDEGSSMIYSVEPNEKVEFFSSIKKETMDQCINNSLSLDYQILIKK